MNTRGLVEIIVLDIGLQLGVITPPLFAMMVVMAVATTLMTGPLLSAIGRCFGQPSQRQEQDARPALPLKASIASKSAAVA
jgi:Kef-type K+ transport system membrane component KefB